VDVSRADHFTLVFDRPVALRSVAVITGRPDGDDRLDVGALEVSADGRTFVEVGQFVRGSARAEPRGLRVRAVRVRPGADLRHPLVVREITIDSRPQVEAFRHPVEFTVDVKGAPDLREWAEAAARECERAYPMICEELKSDGFKPRTTVTLALRDDYDGIAMANGGRVTGSARYFRTNPDDLGALVHTASFVVQRYRSPDNPPWLVKGIADYVRFFRYEPGRLGRIDPDLAQYDGSSRMTAAFLAYVAERYDPGIVRELNRVMRDGEYDENVWPELTGQTLWELGEEWRASLRR
jgi:Peptidase of plants and bacteria